jgi:FkbM family methyltransferase
MGAVLDEALQRAFPKGETPIRFLQIGGNDGVYQDPLYQHHVRGTFDFDWGHIFEPIPEYFEKLTKNMRPFGYVTCHQLAVDNSEMPGKRKFSYVSPEDVERAELPPSSMGIGSFSLSGDGLGDTPYPEAKYLAVKEYIRTIEVDTIPVSLLVERYPTANFMITDCEGHDLDLVRGAVLEHGLRPTVLQFEHARPGDELLKSTLTGLRSLGYGIAAAGKDYVAQLS